MGDAGGLVWAAFVVGAVTAVGLGGAARAADGEFVVPLAERPPRIDGRIDPDEWAAAASFEGFQYDGRLQQRRARAWVAATADAIFVAIRTQLPDEGKLQAEVDRDSLKAVFDDSVEVWVTPSPDAEARVVYQFLVNSLGKGGYAVHLSGGAEEDMAWRGDWEHAHGMHDGAWHFECRVPVASMKSGAGRRTTSGGWGVNVTRNWKNPWEWSSIAGPYGPPKYRFRFVREGAPAVAFSASADPFVPPVELELRLSNPGRAPLDLDCSLALERNRMPALKNGGKVRLAPGAKKTFTVKVPENDPTTRYELAATVTSADGRTVFYDRKTAWPKGETYRWAAGEKKRPPPLDFKFAYYPYLNRVRIAAEISGLPRDAKPEWVGAVVRKKGGPAAKEVAFPLDAFKDGRQEVSVELPELEGECEIALKATGEGCPEGEVVKPFERTRFEWERNPAGRSTKIYPPFEPIRTRGRRLLKTVLRDHTLGDLGLLDQVVARSAETGVAKPILARPMSYVVKAGGAAQKVTPSRFAFASRKPHEVVAEGGFAAGALAGRAKMTWDYDGTARVELVLSPAAGQDEVTVDELTLEIPFRADAATLIHANSDRIRAPVAGPVPGGEGVVWDATKVACDEFVRNFCPYVYLGDAVRGLSWFAENDRGWGWDPKAPNLDVSREGNEVILRVRLVNSPTMVREPRTITFGLLAAPVKPRLSPGGPSWWRYRFYRDRYSLLGTDINWLALGDCGSVYPAGRDMHFWEMIARGNTEQIPDAEVEATVERGRKLFEPYGPDKVRSWEAHVRHNLRCHLGQNMVFYYNRASCQLFEEFETFKDEWCLDDLRSVPKGNGIWEIKIVPSESYIDHALFWYAKSFEIGRNRGVYWDNWFIAPTFNTVMTDAYRRADGSVVPAAGIWRMRELCKRTFVMMYELGMKPITFPHMTSFSPLPMLSFATVQYDWEWKYSEGDVHDRYTREMIQLISTGELAGVWPVPLGDHGNLSNDLWTQRTFTGVRLVHELDGYGGFGSDWEESHKQNRKLVEPILKMLDEPGLVVYRYWDERPQPVRGADPDMPTVVYSLPGKEAVAAVTSYAKADGEAALSVDAAALGFKGGVTVEDAVTGERLELRGGKVRFDLKKHDVRVLRIRAGE